MAANGASIFVGLKPLERAAALGVFLLFIFVVAAVAIDQRDSGLIPVFLTFLIYMTALALPIVLYRQGWGLFHPLVFAVLWWGLIREVMPRLGLYGTGMEQHRALPGWGEAQLNLLVVKALLLDTLALLCMYLGFTVGRSVRFSDLSFELGRPKWIVPKMLLIMAIALVGFFRLIKEAGGLGGLLLQRGLSPDEQIFAQIGGHWAFLASTLRPACLVWLALKPEVWRRPLFVALFGLALFMNFGATGSRSGVIVPVLAALAIWCLHYRRIPYLAVFIAGVCSLGAVGLLGEFREETRGADTMGEVHVQSGVVGGVEKGLQVIAERGEDISGVYGIMGKVPHSIGLLYGESYLSVPAAPIPSAIFPGKPDAGGKLNGTMIFNEPLTGYPPGNMAEAYWNFHIPGVVVVFFLWGMFLKWLATLYRSHPGNSMVLIVYVLTLLFMQPNSVAAYKWLQAVVPALAFLVFFCGMRVRRSAAPAGAGAPLPH